MNLPPRPGKVDLYYILVSVTHTLDIECKGVLSIGLQRLFVKNRVYVGLTLYSLLREQANNVRMVVSTLWHGPGNIHGFILDGKSSRLPRLGYCSSTKCDHRFRCEDNNVQPHNYRVQLVEPCHH